MKNLIIILSLVALSVACNKGTDPKKEFSDVKTVAGKGEKSETIDVAMIPFQFKMITTTELGYASFVAGVQGEIRFQVIPGQGVTEYTIKETVKPDGSQFVKIEDHVYALKWQPDQNEPNNRAVFQMEAVVRNATDSAKIGLGGMSEKYIINIDKQANLPQIKGINGLRSQNGQIPTLTLGDSKEFTVEVEDPLSSSQNPPRLVNHGCQTGNNREAPKEVAGNALKRISDTHVTGTKKFHYRYELNLDSRNFRENVNPNGFELCFEFQVFAGQRASEVRNQNVRVLVEPKKPLIDMPTGTQNVHRGQTFTALVNITIPGAEVGKLELVTTELTGDNFPGEVTFEDVTSTSRLAGRKNAVSKIFRWDVASNADAFGRDRQISFKVTAKHIVTRNGVELPPQTKEETLNFRVIEKTVTGATRANNRRTTPAAGGQ